MKKCNIFIVLSIVIFSGCDYLDIVPDNIPTMEMAFTTRQNAEKFLLTCYSHVPEHANVYQNPGLASGDEFWNCAEKTFYYSNSTSFGIAKGYQNTNDPLLNYWSGGQSGYNMFICIHDCNTFLENIGKVPDMTATEKNRWMAEVKTLKAFFHYFLLQLYGPIPCIRENTSVTASLEEMKMVREPVDEVIKYIVQLLDEAIDSDGLPLNIRAENTELGRLTKPAALALKAKVLVLAASPLFNGNPDFPEYRNTEGVQLINSVADPQKWEAAREACFEAIQVAHQAGHQLYAFDDMLMNPVSDTTLLELTIRNTITARFNKELIWGLGDNYTGTLQSIVNAPLTAYQQGKQIYWCRAMQNPTLDIAEQFYSQNGVPIELDKDFDYEHRYDVDYVPAGHDYYLESGFRTAKLHFYREPRFYASLGFDGGKWFNLEASSDKNSFVVRNKAGQVAGKDLDNFNITGYFAKKLVNYKLIMTEASNTQSTVSYPFPIIRLADLYLMYAEALNECKETPDDEVYEYIQLVRDKAGLDKTTRSLVKTWEQYAKDEYKDRPKGKIGMRDIIRQERLVELALEGQRFYDLRRWRLARTYLTRPVRGWNVAEETELGYYQVKYIFFRNFMPKDYFWPIKDMDLYKNDKLKQSPQW